MTSRTDWDNFINENYDAMILYAERLTPDATDLVHHTFLRVIKYGTDVKSLKTYFRRAMFIEATRGKFKKIYELKDPPKHTHVSDYDLSEAFMREDFTLACDRLNWFDREVLRLHLEGWNLTQIARESGINSSVFHTSIHRSREKLKNFFGALNNQYIKGKR